MKPTSIQLAVEIILSVLMFSGCVEDIVMDPHEKNLPVAVNCILRADQHDGPQTQTLTMCYVKGKSDSAYEYVENATVYIQYSSYDTAEIDGTIHFSYVGEGRWESIEPMSIVRNNRYHLHVDIPDRDPVSACTICPDCHFTGHVNLSAGSGKAGQMDLYRIPESDAATDSTSLWIIAQEYADGEWKNLDYIVSTHPKADDFNVSSMKFSDLTMNGKPDSGDAQDARLQELMTMYQDMQPDLPVHETVLRIGDVNYHDPFFLFAGPMMFPHIKRIDSSPVPEMDPKELTWDFFFRFQLNWVNTDLDKYFRSVYAYDYQRDHFLTAIYSAPDVYSNVKGGVGIFGIKYTDYHGFVEPDNLN